MIRIKKQKKGFTLIELLVTSVVFMIMAGAGVGAYFQYYFFSLANNEINGAITLINQTRFKALKNPIGAAYGIHVDTVNNALTTFVSTYNPSNDGNIIYKLKQLSVTDLNLLPNIGTTDEILFEGTTGKTQNTGSFTIGNENYSYTFNLNIQGVIN